MTLLAMLRMLVLLRIVWTALGLQLPSSPRHQGHEPGAPAPILCHRPLSGLERAVEAVRTRIMLFDQRNDEDCAVQHYRGGLYVVTATVALHPKTRLAEISLSGIVLGGTLTGTGTLDHPDDEAGGVVLDEQLQESLSRRFISIQRAELNRTDNTVTVEATVPLLGKITIFMKRVGAPDEDAAGECYG